MSKTKNKPGIHLYKTTGIKRAAKLGEKVWRTEYYWHIVASKGRITAHSETYSRKSGAVKGIKAAKELFKKYWCGYYDHSKKDCKLKSYL